MLHYSDSTVLSRELLWPAGPARPVRPWRLAWPALPAKEVLWIYMWFQSQLRCRIKFLNFSMVLKIHVNPCQSMSISPESVHWTASQGIIKHSTGRGILYLQPIKKLTSQREIRTLWTELTTNNTGLQQIIQACHLTCQLGALTEENTSKHLLI